MERRLVGNGFHGHRPWVPDRVSGGRAKPGLVYERFHSTLFYARGNFYSPLYHLRAGQQNAGCQSPLTTDPQFRPGFCSEFLAGGKLIRFGILLPEYLEQVQNYSASQTGEAMVLIGLPQLLIFPFVPRLMKAFDLRLIVFAGALIFGGSCLLNVHMNPAFGGPQFQIANVIRALGQPFTIVPLSALATAGLVREQRADGSALFNIMRNLGGSAGTAL